MSVEHAAIMLDQMLSQFGHSTQLRNLVSVLGTRLNGAEQCLDDLREKRWIDTSEGAQLDGCGGIVDQARLIDQAVALPFFGFISQPSARGFGKARFRGRLESYLTTANLADPEYRKLIHAKVAKNISSGLAEEMIASYQAIYAAPRVILTEQGYASVRIGVARRLSDGERVFAQAVNLFVRPGGVRINIRTHFDSVNTFGFRNQGFKGFGHGSLARTF